MPASASRSVYRIERYWVNSTGRRNTSMMRCCDGKTETETVRPSRSACARGLSSEDAAVSCGVSPPVGGRWFREGGGMPPISLAPPAARYLSFAEREEIAIHWHSTARRMRDIESDTGYDTQRRAPDDALALLSQTAVYDTC